MSQKTTRRQSYGQVITKDVLDGFAQVPLRDAATTAAAMVKDKRAEKLMELFRRVMLREPDSRSDKSGYGPRVLCDGLVFALGPEDNQLGVVVDCETCDHASTTYVVHSIADLGKVLDKVSVHKSYQVCHKCFEVYQEKCAADRRETFGVTQP